MEQKDKDLLLKDLCGRLPNGVKVDITYSKECGSSLRSKICSKGVSTMDTLIFWLFQEGEVHLRPYLLPLSSMTPKQKAELSMLVVDVEEIFKSFLIEVEFYHKHHIDYRGLIEKSLALDATNLGIYE